MVLTQHKRAVGIFPTIEEAVIALTELKAAGFPMEKVSIVAKDEVSPDDLAGASVKSQSSNRVEEGAEMGAFTGGTLGTLTGLLVGLGALAIPGIGPILLGGAAATALATTLAGTAIGTAAGGLFGGLVGLGIPEERAQYYHDRVSIGEYLAIVDGTEDEILLASQVLSQRGIQEWNIYDTQTDNPASVAASQARR